MEMVTKDLAIDLQTDRPGQLFKAVEAIAKAGINIEGYCEVEGILHLVTNDPAGARRAVEGAGFKVREEREVLVTDVENRPGFLASILRPVAEAGINLGASYSLVSNRVVLTADDLGKLRDAVSKAAPVAARR